MIQLYSRPSLSLLCLSRITAYLEVKSGPRFQHENFTTGYIILLKRGEIAPQDFLNILNTSLTSRLEAHIHLWKWLFDLFFISQFCKFDMSRYGYLKIFQTVIRLRDNESRLYSCLYHKIYMHLYESQYQKTYLRTCSPSIRAVHYENKPIQIYWKIYHQKNENFQIKILIFFIFLLKNIDWRYSLEPPRRGGSNGYPQFMFLSRNKTNNVYPYKPHFYYIKVGFKGVNFI